MAIADGPGSPPYDWATHAEEQRLLRRAMAWAQSPVGALDDMLAGNARWRPAVIPLEVLRQLGKADRPRP